MSRINSDTNLVVKGGPWGHGAGRAGTEEPRISDRLGRKKQTVTFRPSVRQIDATERKKKKKYISRWYYVYSNNDHETLKGGKERVKF